MRNLYHIPVTQDHLDAGQSATWQNRVGNVAVIPHGQRVLSRAALDALLADHRLLDDGRQIHYYCRHDRTALMAACDGGRDAEVQPQTVRFTDLPTYDAYCASRAGSDWGCVGDDRRRQGVLPPGGHRPYPSVALTVLRRRTIPLRCICSMAQSGSRGGSDRRSALCAELRSRATWRRPARSVPQPPPAGYGGPNA